MSFILPILGLIVVCLFGSPIYVRFFKEQHPLEAALVSFAFGFGILGFLLFILNQFAGVDVNQNSALGLLAFMLLCFLLAFVNYRGAYLSLGCPRCFGPGIQSFVGSVKKSPWQLKLLGAGVMVMIGLVLYKLLFFPIVDPEELAHGAFVSGYTLEHGSPPGTKDSLYNDLNAHPSLFLFQASWLQALSGEESYHVYNLAQLPYVLGVILLSYLFTQRLFKDRLAGLLALTFLLSSPVFAADMIHTGTEAPFIFYTLLTLYLYHHYHQGKEKDFLVLTGVVLGFALLLRYGSLFFLVSFMAALVLTLLKADMGHTQQMTEMGLLLQKLDTRLFRRALYILVPALLLWSPLLLRNLLEYQDPFYPFITDSGRVILVDDWGTARQLSLDWKLVETALIPVFALLVWTNSLLVLLFFWSWTRKGNSRFQRILFFFTACFFILVLLPEFYYKDGDGQQLIRHAGTILPVMAILGGRELAGMVRNYSEPGRYYKEISKVLILLFLVYFAFVALDSYFDLGSDLLSSGEMFQYLAAPFFFLAVLGFLIFFDRSSKQHALKSEGLEKNVGPQQVESETSPGDPGQDPEAKTKTKNSSETSTFLLPQAKVKASLGFLPALLLMFIILLPSSIAVVEEKYDWTDSGLAPEHPGDREVIIQQLGEDYYELYTWMNQNLNDTHRVLSFLVLRYYLDCEVLPGDSELLETIYRTDSLSLSLKLLQKEGVDHILHVTTDCSKYTKYDPSPYYKASPIFRNLDMENIFQPSFQNPSFTLYRLNYPQWQEEK